MRPLITLGDLIADLGLGLEAFPVNPDQHQTLAWLTLGPGGAGNVLLAAARLGVPTLALGALGADWVGERVLACLRAEGVDVTHVVQRPGEATTVAVVARSSAGQGGFLGYAGTRGLEVLPANYPTLVGAAGALWVDGWAEQHDHPAPILAGVELAAEAGLPVLFDPGPLAGKLDRAWREALLRRTSILLVTEGEGRALLSGTDLSEMPALLEGLRALGPQVVIVKRGAQGCVIAAGAEVWTCPGYRVAVQDPTAAGDCFAAAVAWGVITGQPWDVIGAVANAAGAVKVTKIGTALAAPTRAEVRELLRRDLPGPRV